MAFNVLYYDTSDNSLKQATSSIIDQIAEHVLENMASGTYAGTITVGNTNSIGTFIDTYRQGAVNTKNTTILSTTYTLSQVNTIQRPNSPPNYLGLTISGNEVAIQESATTLNQLADEIISRMVNGGPNSYALGVSAPSDGGTWVSRGTLLDTLENETVINTNYKLWHKTTSPTYTGINERLLKLNGSEIVEFSNTDILNLIRIVESRIISTGIGTYVLQQSAPTTGTWVSVGTVQDVRRNAADVNYAAAINYVGNYAGNYVGSSGKFTTTYVGNYAGNYTRNISYAGLTVNSGTSTITTRSLWKRIS